MIGNNRGSYRLIGVGSLHAESFRPQVKTIDNTHIPTAKGPEHAGKGRSPCLAVHGNDGAVRMPYIPGQQGQHLNP